MERTEWQERIGIGERCVALGRTGPKRTRKIVTEEGPARGKVGGYQIDHKDGRVDAVVTPPAVSTKGALN